MLVELDVAHIFLLHLIIHIETFFIILSLHPHYHWRGLEAGVASRVIEFLQLHVSLLHFLPLQDLSTHGADNAIRHDCGGIVVMMEVMLVAWVLLHHLLLDERKVLLL